MGKSKDLPMHAYWHPSRYANRKWLMNARSRRAQWVSIIARQVPSVKSTPVGMALAVVFLHEKLNEML